MINNVQEAGCKIFLVFINYYSISREAFMQNRMAQSQTNYYIYILALKVSWQLFFCISVQPFKGREISQQCTL